MLSARKFKPKSVTKKRDDLETRFAAVFHSYKDLHRVAPIQFLARLKRRGVTLVSVRRPSQQDQTQGE